MWLRQEGRKRGATHPWTGALNGTCQAGTGKQGGGRITAGREGYLLLVRTQKKGSPPTTNAREGTGGEFVGKDHIEALY